MFNKIKFTETLPNIKAKAESLLEENKSFAEIQITTNDNVLRIIWGEKGISYHSSPEERILFHLPGGSWQFEGEELKKVFNNMNRFSWGRIFISRTARDTLKKIVNVLKKV